jgi:hypothetical protein
MIDKGDKSTGDESVVPLNLVVNKFHQHEDMEEEEEEDDDDDDDNENMLPVATTAHDDIEQFVNSL